MKAYNFRQLRLAGSADNSNRRHPCKVLNKGVDVAGPEKILALLPNLPQASAGKSMAKSTVQVPMSGGQIGNGVLQRRPLRGKRLLSRLSSRVYAPVSAARVSTRTRSRR